ncbi:MAG: hypothetical protein CMJ48_01475 [Planctomycetaceae bacterium]|nr:hypothetical protein [Planctomycetaceae bacterium]
MDQKRGVLYYQRNGEVLKIRAHDGEVLKEAAVGSPNGCISWNTVLIDDERGRFVATRWYGKPEWDSAIRVYDDDLNLAWERTGLPNGKKDTLTYAEGKLVCGSGNGWSKKYTGDEWKHITAFNIADGEIAWKCDLTKYDYIGILNVPYFNGYFYAENGGSPPQTTKCFRINADNGKLEEVYDYGRMITSCATHIVAHGKILSGDLWNDSIVVTKLSDNSTADWPGPFGDPQTNQMAAPRESGVTLAVIQEVASKHAPAIAGEDPTVAETRPNLAHGATIKARSRIKGEQADVTRMLDGDPQTWWATGAGDLALDPVDVDLQLEAPHVVDTVVVQTSSLKGQLRLKDFDLFAGLGDVWDGGRPLAKIRDNNDKRIRVTFPAVRLDRIRIRPLGTRRPDNAFAHIAELRVHAADGPPKRTVESSPFPRTLADAGHDPEFLRTLIGSLESKGASSRITRARVDSLKSRLELIKESRQYEDVLKQITADTEQYRKLDAPEWALAQRDCMARLRTWAHYWIDHQQPDGQFGGSYEDDVELVCGWPVLALAQDDEKVRDALELLAEGVWKSKPFLERFGYDRLTDVEHAAENTSYSQPRMVVLDYENPKWAERCRRTTATMREHFLSRNEKGGLQFRSDYFGFDPRTLKPVTREQERPFDIPQSAKALKPAMYAFWATGDPLARQLMLECGDTWVEGARANADDEGRIAGLLPERLSWPSGASVGTHARLSSMRATLFHLIGCYYVSGEDRYLEPIRTLLRKSLVDWSVKDVPSAGTLDQLQDEDMTGLLEQLALIAVSYRRATGDRRFDAPLARWSARIRDSLVDDVKSYVYLNRNSDRLWYVDRPLTVGAYLESRCAAGAQLYLGWQVTGDEDYLAKLGWNLSSCLNDKWGAFTYWFYDKSERRVTSNDHSAHKLQCSESALSLMYLGGPAPVEAVWPQFAVTWKNVGTNFCALVRHNDSERLLVELYSFDEQPRIVTADLWELAAGDYKAALGTRLTEDSHVTEPTWSRSLDVAGSEGRRPTSLHFTLPARKRTILEIRPRG